MRRVYTNPRPALDRDGILSAVDFAAFWRDELPGAVFKRSTGWQCGGTNPARADARPGSFRVNLDSGAWCDFADGTGGDALEWLRLRHGLTFPEALECLQGYAL